MAHLNKQLMKQRTEQQKTSPCETNQNENAVWSERDH